MECDWSRAFNHLIRSCYVLCSCVAYCLPGISTILVNFSEKQDIFNYPLRHRQYQTKSPSSHVHIQEWRKRPHYAKRGEYSSPEPGGIAWGAPSERLDNNQILVLDSHFAWRHHDTFLLHTCYLIPYVTGGRYHDQQAGHCCTYSYTHNRYIVFSLAFLFL